MKQKLFVEFTKMNGAGNDFIVIDNRFFHFSDEELATIARTFCPRKVGIGADGVLALSRPVDESAHFRMRYLNADGSIGTMCGNGARCLARFARLGGINEDPLVFETDAGIHTAWIPDAALPDVEVLMADPSQWREVEELSGGSGHDTYFLWTGTEHVVRFVDGLDDVDVAGMGPRMRHDAALAPRGANINFVEVAGDDVVRIRTYEKGVEAETSACGTGAVAAAVAAFRTGRTKSNEIHVESAGGRLGVRFEQDASGALRDVRLSGPAEIVFRGTFEWD